MAEFTLYIGSKAYSSWSLRGWLMCKLAGIAFEEAFHHMDAPDWKEWVASISPSAKVPVLKHGDLLIWESLAIAEYLAELFPQAGMWPKDRAARARARVISNEMHAGFAELRKAMWMGLLHPRPGKGRTPGALADIARITSLWRETKTKFGSGGPFLFGTGFNIADAMYAPVVVRFATWEPELPKDAKTYVEAVWNHPHLLEWRRAAMMEKPVARYEAQTD
jgi:glutathione S-transferase